MGKCKDPQLLVVDRCFIERNEDVQLLQSLRDKGHCVIDFEDPEIAYYLPLADMIISPKAQMTPLNRLAYVVKKLKDIVKEVKG